MRYPIAALCLLLFVSFAVSAQDTAPPGQEHFDRGVGLIRDERFEEAIEAFRAAERLSPKEPAIPANIGQIYLRLGRPSDAIAPLRKAVTLEPSAPPFRIELCRALSLTKDHDAAIKECEKAVERDPQWDRAHSALFIARQQAGRPTEELLRTIDTALGLLRDSEMLLVLGADQYFLNGDYLYARELLERLTSLFPDNPAYHGRLAEAYLRSGRDADALASARKALSLAPDNSFGNYAMGRIFYDLGQHQEAIESFSKVHSDDPRLVMADYFRGVSLSRSGRQLEALAVLERLVQRIPRNADFYAELAGLYFQMARYENAIEAYKNLVELRPQDFRAIAGLGAALSGAARYDEGIRYLNKALELAPGDEIITMYLRVSESRRNYTPQIAAMKRFADNNPKDVQVRLKLVQLLSFGSRIDEAEAYAKQIYELNPPNSEVFQLMGVSFYDAGRYQEAARAYERSILIEDNPSARLGLAGLYAKSGEHERATASYERVFELKPDAPNVLVIYAKHLISYGKRREGLSVLRRSLAMLPNNPDALYNAGLQAEALGEHEAALQYLDMLRPLDPGLAGILERCIKLRILR